ncbi:MAG TPA: O-methyltransferase [Thermotogota bacterium]|nr:O-methyltransferase [Thermotogota bacterium]HPR96878.1 O-methyltransferase [Thermotogota bacterium]
MNFDTASRYIESFYLDDSRLNRENYIKNTELKEFTSVIEDDSSRLIQILLKISNAKKVLEIGTSIGYSTVSIATTLRENNGRVVTIEYDKAVAEQAKKNFERTGLSNYIELITGDCREVLPKLSGPYDVIFQDSAKPLYSELLDDCVRLLRRGGFLIADDVLFPVMEINSEEMTQAIERFNGKVTRHPELETTILPVGDGLLIAVKK